MSNLNPMAWWGGFLALPNSHPFKTAGMALLVALSCSLLVSITSVMLRPLQEANRLGQDASSMMALLDRLGAGRPERLLVELASGAYVPRDPGTRTELAPGRDPARIGSREDVATVYEVRDRGALQLVVLPVRGGGYQSTLRGYLALEADLNTVAALTFHQHNETPGMGARIGEEGWQASWRGKQVADAAGEVRIAVVKGSGSGPHEVDGITGASVTGSGVTELLRFWLGTDGYGSYLERLREGEAR